MKYLYTTIMILAMSTVMVAQQAKLKRANTDFENYAYMEAIETYEELVEKGLTEEEIYKNLGNANYFNAHYKEAAKWYGKLVNLGNEDLDPSYLYYYAQTLKSSGDYAQADELLKEFASKTSDDKRAASYNNQPFYLKAIERNSGRYEIKNLSVNSKFSDFCSFI